MHDDYEDPAVRREVIRGLTQFQAALEHFEHAIPSGTTMTSVMRSLELLPQLFENTTDKATARALAMEMGSLSSGTGNLRELLTKLRTAIDEMLSRLKKPSDPPEGPAPDSPVN